MGIYIKGMGLPASCAECPVNMDICKRGYKYLLERLELYYKRADDCPISYVPPHGRLIDADALCDGLVSNHPVVIRAKCAPTIIPAEEGET